MLLIVILLFLVFGFFGCWFGIRELIKAVRRDEAEYYNKTLNVVFNSLVSLLAAGMYCWASYRLPEVIVGNTIILALLTWTAGILIVITAARYVDRHKNDENIGVFRLMGLGIALAASGALATSAQANALIIFAGVLVSAGVTVFGICAHRQDQVAPSRNDDS